MSKGLGYLQKYLVEYALENNRITLNYAAKYYGSKETAKNTLLKLQARELLTPSGMGEWSPTEKAKEVLEK
jgi:hypothetical protein